MVAITFPVLENGEWVTRTMDLPQLLDRKKETQASSVGAIDPLPITPNLGLLSKTATRSPVVNSILPAQLRRKELSDVVFVGEDCIHIKEIHPDGRIEHIATKADFGARIWSSRVLELAPWPTDASNKHWTDESLNKEHHMSEHGDCYDPMDIDATQQELPPQILVLTLDSLEVAFVYLRQSSDGSHEFRQVTVPLPTPLDYLETLGRHLAIDPRSRAIAVGAWEGSFIIFHTKEAGQLREEFSKDVQDWCPVQAQQILKVNGVILKMEFIHPGPEDEDDVVLVLIVARYGRIQIHSYAWNFSDGLEERPEDTRFEKIAEGE